MALLVCALAAHSAATPWRKIASIDIPFFQGEGLEYDKVNNRLVLGSVSTGKLIGIPVPTDLSVTTTYTELNVYHYSNSSNASLPAVVGLEIDQDNSCLLYGAAALFPDNATAPYRGALHTFDLCSAERNRLVSEVDLTPLLGAAQLVDDQTKIGNYLYVTDLFGSQILRVSVTAAGVLSAPEKYLEVRHPNGIEHIGSVLIITQYDDYQLYRYDTATSSGTAITLTPPRAISGDGILFDADKSVLVVADVYQKKVFALRSYDNWYSAEVVFESEPIDLSICTTPTAPALVNNTLFLYCAFAFNQGPYSIIALDGLNTLAPKAPLHPEDSQLVATLNMSFFVGEGIEYDPANQRLVLGSIQSGRVVGLPLPRLSDPAVTYEYTSASLHTYFAGNASSSGSAVGLQVDQDDACLMYGANSLFPDSLSAAIRGGLSTYNLCADTLVSFTDLTSLMNPTGQSLMNDVTRVRDNVYVTDYTGNQVIQVTGQNSGAPFAKKAFDLPWPNGIEHVGEVLIVVQPNVYNFYRYDTATRLGHDIQIFPEGSAIEILGPPSSANEANGDGIIFDSSRTYLFVVNNHGTLVDTVSVLASYDNWHSARVLMHFKAGCGTAVPSTTATLVDDDTLYVYCAAGFGAGPYTVRAIRNLKSKLAPLQKLAVAHSVDAPSSGALLSAFNRLTGAWGQGDRATWEALTKPTTRMKIAAIGLDALGPANQWPVRQYLATNFAGVGPDEPLSWVNTYDTSVVDVASRTIRTTMKSFTIANGTLIVVGDWTVTFDSAMKASWIHQDMLFSPNVGIGSPAAAITNIVTPAGSEVQTGDGKATSALGLSAVAVGLSVVALVLPMLKRSSSPLVNDQAQNRMLKVSEVTGNL